MIVPWSFPNAITDPVKVIEPIQTPIYISTRWIEASAPVSVPCPASMWQAYRTAVAPTKLWIIATSCGIAVSARAIDQRPDHPRPVSSRRQRHAAVSDLKPRDERMIIPTIPNRLLRRSLSCRDNPRANIKSALARRDISYCNKTICIFFISFTSFYLA